MHDNLEKFEKYFSLPSVFGYVPYNTACSFTEIGLQRTEISKRSVRWQVWTIVVPRFLSLPPKERIMGTMLGVDG